MKTLSNINPNLQTDLRSEKAQGADVGDRGISNGVEYQWTGVNWERSGGGGGGSSSSSSSSTPMPSFEETIRKAIAMTQEANKPVIASYQAAIPEIQNKYETTRTQLQAEVDPLKARYDNLLSQIKGNQTTAENRQTKTTRNELARRGFTPSSSYFEQEMTGAVNPITQQYTGLYKDAVSEQEAGLRGLQNQITNLTGDETSALRTIYDALAQAQAGANTSGINIGSNLYGNQLSQYNTEQERIRTDKQREIENAIKQQELKIKQQTTPSSDWTKLTDNMLYNAATGEVKSINDATGTGANNDYGTGSSNGSSNVSSNRLVPTSQYKKEWGTPPPGYGFNAYGQLLPL